MTRYLIIGNGVAGTTAAEVIRSIDQNGSITIISDEDLPFYSRIRLNDYIGGDISESELIIKKEQWYKDSKIDLFLKTRIRNCDRERRVMIDQDGKEFYYDRLLLATGSKSFIPPIKGSDINGVFTLRNIADARKIISAADMGNNVVIIGGGLLGLETGNGFVRRGKKVTVVEFFPRLLPRQLDTQGAAKLQNIMENMGFSFRLGSKTEEINGGTHVEEVVLEGGEGLPADLVVISAGVRPDMELAHCIGVEFDKGIIVDEYLRTGRSDVYAAGDVAQFGPMPYGIWPAAADQGKIAGLNMAGRDMEYSGSAVANTLKIVGIDLASAGDIDEDGKYESIIMDDKSVYKKIVIQNNRILGGIMLGDKKGFNSITKAMEEKRDLSAYKDFILTEGFDFNEF